MLDNCARDSGKYYATASRDDIRVACLKLPLVKQLSKPPTFSVLQLQGFSQNLTRLSHIHSRHRSQLVSNPIYFVRYMLYTDVRNKRKLVDNYENSCDNWGIEWYGT